MTDAVNPMFQLGLDVMDKACLVLGGNAEAEEKSARLFNAGGDVTVVCPEITSQLSVWAAEGRVRHYARRFEVGDLSGAGEAVLLVLNTEEKALAGEIYDLCVERRILINTYDSPQLSSVSMAALVDPGHLRISISTSNTSPALAGRLRRDLEGLFDAEFDEYLDLLGRVRSHLKVAIADPEKRRRILRELAAGFHLEGTLSYPDGWRERAQSLLAEKRVGDA